MGTDTSGRVYLGGRFDAIAGIPYPSNLAFYLGGAFAPADIDLANIGDVYAITLAPDGTMVIGGGFQGTANAASIAKLSNAGMAQVYPVVRFRAPSSGTARVFQLANTTTGDTIYFNLSLLAGETATLSLIPGRRAFTSDYRGNILSSIIPGSNLATWRMLPGTNTISCFIDNFNCATSIYWRPRGWSADLGTIL